jgi:hypothetical protein
LSYLATLEKDDEGVYIRTRPGESMPLTLGTGAEALREFMGWCGCGQPDEALAYLGDILAFYDREREGPFNWEAYKAEEAKAFRTNNNIIMYALAYFIDSKGLTEHGGNISGAWLTTIGKSILHDISALRDAGELDVSDTEVTTA